MKFGKILSKEWYGAAMASVTPKKADFYPDIDLQLFAIQEFLSKDKCEEIIDAFKDKVEPATTTTGKENFRTSHVYEAARDEENRDLVLEIENKMSDAMNLCFSHSEGLLFEKFSEGEYFKPHMANISNTSSAKSSIEFKSSNLVLSLLNLSINISINLNLV